MILADYGLALGWFLGQLEFSLGLWGHNLVKRGSSCCARTSAFRSCFHWSCPLTHICFCLAWSLLSSTLNLGLLSLSPLPAASGFHSQQPPRPFCLLFHSFIFLLHCLTFWSLAQCLAEASSLLSGFLYICIKVLKNDFSIETEFIKAVNSCS